jgi:hypothetical protein
VTPGGDAGERFVVDATVGADRRPALADCVLTTPH